MVRQRIIVEEGGSYRKDDVDGAKITTMCLVEREKGGLVALLDFDDEKGAATYNLTMKEEIMGHDNDAKDRVVSDFFDFGKINKALTGLGYIPYVDFTTKEWGCEPSIIGMQAWIKMAKTGTGKDKNGNPIDYKALIDVIRIGNIAQESRPVDYKALIDAQESRPKNSEKPSRSSNPIPVPVKGELTPELYEKWKTIALTLITNPMTEVSINAAIKKANPTDTVLRLSLNEVRAKALERMIADGILEKQVTPDGVMYSQAV